MELTADRRADDAATVLLHLLSTGAALGNAAGIGLSLILGDALLRALGADESGARLIFPVLMALSSGLGATALFGVFSPERRVRLFRTVALGKAALAIVMFVCCATRSLSPLWLPTAVFDACFSATLLIYVAQLLSADA